MNLITRLRRSTALLFVCVFVVVGCAGATPTPPAEPIEIRLATIPHLSRLAQDLTQAFSKTYPYVTFELAVMPAQEAIDAIATQDVDVALVARSIDPPRDELEATQIGRRPVVLAVHPSNPVETLTWEQVRDIFSGRVWDWASIDPQWDTQEILVVSQQDGAVSRVSFETQVMEGARVTPRAVVATGDDVAGRLIAGDPAAIGYLLAGVADDEVKVLSIEGTTPTASSTASESWPITRPINLVVHVDANVYVLDFVDFSIATRPGD
ncbi:MAG: substrate-binding domain-containing protein [Anaerolineae bacterium]